MSRAKLTLIGLTDYESQYRRDLWENVTLPEGIEKNLLVNNILMNGGEFEVLYPDPETARTFIGFWFRRNYRTFEKWINALDIEYEPLYNYDRYEEWTDEETGESSTTYGHKNTRALNTTNTQTNNLTETVEVDSETEGKRSAMDASTYQPYDQSIVDADTETKNTGTITNVTGGSNTDTESGTDTNARDLSTEHTGHLYGNIGVTTSQQMLQSELDIAAWNIYEHITDMFLRDFTIPVYE